MYIKPFPCATGQHNGPLYCRYPKSVYARETANVSSLEGILILNRLVSLNSYTLDTCLQLGLSTQLYVNTHRQLRSGEYTTIYKV